MNTRQIDALLSRYIRLRDTRDGGYCISCGKYITFDTCDAGHYHKRNTAPAIKYDERNVNAQCRECNGTPDGNKACYEDGLIRKYGAGIFEELLIAKRYFKHIDIDERTVFWKSEIEKFNKSLK